MKKLFFIFLTILLLSGCRIYRLPDARLKPEIVCGYKICEPGNFGDVYNFYRKPFSPNVDSTTTIKDVATSIIGHSFPNKDIRSGRVFTCTIESDNPFQNEVVNLVNPDGKDINYSRSEKLDLDINAAVEANLEELKKINPNMANLPEIEAKITAAYSRINNKNLIVQAKYFEWALSDKAIDKLVKDNDFKECKDFLIQKDYRLITAVGIIYFNINFDDKSLDQISSELDAELQKNEITVNIGASFKREVNKSLKTSTKGGFQIVSWRSIPPDETSLRQVLPPKE